MAVEEATIVKETENAAETRRVLVIEIKMVSPRSASMGTTCEV
jgi:hypothetical protein